MTYLLIRSNMKKIHLVSGTIKPDFHSHSKVVLGLVGELVVHTTKIRVQISHGRSTILYPVHTKGGVTPRQDLTSPKVVLYLFVEVLQLGLPYFGYSR